jgi:hypothetical protein
MSEDTYEQQPGCVCVAGWLTLTESAAAPASAALSACESIRRVLISLLTVIQGRVSQLSTHSTAADHTSQALGPKQNNPRPSQCGVRYKRDRNINAPSECKERLLDTLVHLSRGLHEPDAKLVGKLAALLLRHSALVRPVRLVADEDLVHAFRGVLLDVRVPCSDVWRSAVRGMG